MASDVNLLVSLVKITERTNLYAAQKEVALNATFEEIEQYIGILLHMGVMQAPVYGMYWKSDTRYNPIADIFTRSRFDAIKSNFHICDNSAADFGNSNYDRLFKVREL